MQIITPLLTADHFLTISLDLAVVMLATVLFMLTQRRRLAALEAVTCFDPVTRARSGWLFAAELGELGRAAEASGQPLSLIYIDVDHFSRFNDGGHRDMGDRTLHRVAVAITGARRRSSDHLYRLYSAGDEFALVMRGATADRALAQANTILASIRREGLTASAGVACTTTVAWAGLEVAADTACKEAKHRGRDGVQLAGGA